MSDLINGREMLNKYQVDLCYGIACKDCSMSTDDGGCRVEKWIDTFPSADRPQGEWIRTGRTNIYGGIEVQCSNCGDRVMVQHLEDEWYCRHCGADMGMKGADDETD